MLSSNHPDGPATARQNESEDLYGGGAGGNGSGSDAWDSDDMNGYHLLNEVGSGGTLSSLFTILSLFTENVNLAWPNGEEEQDDGGLRHGPPSESSATIIGSNAARRDVLQRSRAGSDVSHLDLSTSTYQEGHSGSPTPDRGAPFPMSSTSSLSNSTVQDWEAIASPSTLGASRPSLSMRSSGRPSVGSHAPSATGSARIPPFSGSANGMPGRQIPRARQSTQPAGLAGAGGSIARASVDTTLAVIPAGMFDVSLFYLHERTSDTDVDPRSCRGFSSIDIQVPKILSPHHPSNSCPLLPCHI